MELPCPPMDDFTGGMLPHVALPVEDSWPRFTVALYRNVVRQENSAYIMHSWVLRRVNHCTVALLPKSQPGWRADTCGRLSGISEK